MNFLYSKNSIKSEYIGSIFVVCIRDEPIFSIFPENSRIEVTSEYIFISMCFVRIRNTIRDTRMGFGFSIHSNGKPRRNFVIESEKIDEVKKVSSSYQVSLQGKSNVLKKSSPFV